MDKNDKIKLENLLCFPLYVAAKEIVREYNTSHALEKAEITYTQYITLLAIWEKKNASVKELGNMLSLDSGTLTPVLKTLENGGYLTRRKNTVDKRILEITITDLGERFMEEVNDVPITIAKNFNLSLEESIQLYALLYKFLGKDICSSDIDLVQSIVENDDKVE